MTIEFTSNVQELAEIDEQKYLTKRYGRPEEIAWMAVYLLSDAASFVTGATMVIDGGRNLVHG